MTIRVLALALANAWMLAFGVGLLPLLGLARTPRDLLAKLPLAYAIGLVATGVLAAELAVVQVPLGWLTLVLLSIASVALGLRRLKWDVAADRPPLARDVPSLAVLALAVAVLIQAARLFSVKPLTEIDGWMIWALKARALFEFGHPAAPVFTTATYAGRGYPLWLPALEASDFRFMGAFDGTLVHLQLLGLAIAFVGAAWVLLRRAAAPLLLAASVLAILTAPAFFAQLQTNFADIPLALLLALGVAALAAWLRTREPGLLPAAALFLGAGAITKNEGEVFALSAFVSAALVAQRAQLRPLALAGLAAFAVDLPWRVWLKLHHVHASAYSLSKLLSPSYLHGHSDRIDTAAHELLLQIRSVDSWSYLSALALAGLAGALVLRRFRLAAFAVSWFALSFAGLLAVYWISPFPLTNHLYNSADRTIDTLVIGAALLAPVLLWTEPSRTTSGHILTHRRRNETVGGAPTPDQG
jgi:hypothetical protein